MFDGSEPSTLLEVWNFSEVECIASGSAENIASVSSIVDIKNDGTLYTFLEGQFFVFLVFFVVMCFFVGLSVGAWVYRK